MVGGHRSSNTVEQGNRTLRTFVPTMVLRSRANCDEHDKE